MEDSEPLNNTNQETPSSNITAIELDLDQETLKKCRGDAIGETLYSEVFVLKTLLQLSDLKWSSEVEEELCSLWDMTVEKDICDYLLKFSFPSLAVNALQKYEEPARFNEIVIGILANLLSFPDCEKKIKREEIESVLNVIHSDDPLILIQVMRFIHAVSAMFDKMEFITEQTVCKFVFILQNSTNSELLTNTIKTLSAITTDFKLERGLIKSEFLSSSTVAYQLINEEIPVASRDPLVTIRYFEIISNSCAYIDDCVSVSHLVQKMNEDINPFLDEIHILLQFYSQSENLILPISEQEEFPFYISAITYIFRVLSIDYSQSIVHDLLEIVSMLITNNSEDLKTVAEPLCYFFSLPNCLNHKNDLKKHRRVLIALDSNSFEFLEFEYLHNLKCIINEE